MLVCLPALLATALAQPSSDVDRRVETMLGKLSIEQKIDLIGGVDRMFTREMPVINLPRLKMSDGPMGVRTWGPTTGYAAGIGLAASWDIELAKRVGESLGRDARSRGVSFLLGPGVNIYRTPLNGRNFEYFGEDPWLAGRIATAYIHGVQSQGVIATVKHYACNNSELDRHGSNSVIDERTLREIYLPVFEAAVKEGHVGAVMDSYNLINGEHATENAPMNMRILKGEWGFRGVLMSDWDATYDGVRAANGGLDLEMPSPKFMNRATLLPAIQAGHLKQAVIDDKVRRILRTAIEFGLLDRDQTDLGIPRYSQESRQVALESAEKSVVLLKNQGDLLPLDKGKIRTIAVLGPDAWPAVVSGGGSAQVTAFAPASILEGLSDSLGSAKVLWNPGVRDLRGIFEAEPGFFTDQQGSTPGLKEERYAAGKIEGTPTQTGVQRRVFNWPIGLWGPAQPDHMAARWSGYYIPKKSGVQRFIVGAAGRDSYKLYVNDKLAIDQPQREGQSPNQFDLEAEAGKPIAVRLEYSGHLNRPTVCFTALLAADVVEPDAAKLAAAADVAVVSVGFEPSTESEGHDRTWRLPNGQDDLIQQVAAANPRTIVVLTAGGGVDTNRWLGHVPALLHTFYGGQEAGRVLVRVLFGEVNPGGKLPMTFERHAEDNPSYKYYDEEPGTLKVYYKEGIFVGYRGYPPDHTQPLFPFGFGLSYTTFAFRNLKVTPASLKSPETTVSFEVQNTGSRAGAEVAQIYVSDPSAKVKRPFEELKGFARVELAPGETKHVSIPLDRRSFAYWDTNRHDWTVDPGKFVIHVGDSSINLPLQADLTLE